MEKNFRKNILTCSFPELDQFADDIDSYEKIHQFSLEKSEQFWDIIAKSRLQWFKLYDQVKNNTSFKDMQSFDLKWFLNGKLNASVNCVDRHYLKNPNKIALIWEKDEPSSQEYFTYSDLYKLMNKISNMLKSYGIKKGDTVVIYMPTCIIAVACMLACARIGAIHSVVFGGFSAESLASRVNDLQSKLIITSNQGLRGGKLIELKKTVDLACLNSPSVEHVFVHKRTNNLFDINPDRDVIIDEVLDKYNEECEPEEMDSEDALFVLYTSGSTGKPKGLVHSTAGYLLGTALTHQLVFDYDSNSNHVFGCLADIAWITGHSYVVYGPLCNGGTSVLFESTPTYPNPGRYWETVERLKINQLYIAPTALRLLMRYGDDWVKKYDKSSLKSLGSVGEPINIEAWHWLNNIVGENRCKIADTYWQTETGSHCLTPLPCNINDSLKPGMAMRPFFGINPVLLNEKGEELENKSSVGILCIREPWPSMARTIYGEDGHNRFVETYLKPYPGYYFTGDGAITDSDGHFRITGRIDDVINVSGHRIGTAEIESALNEHINVAESAVVSFPHDIFGEGIFAFVTLKKNAQLENGIIKNELKNLVKNKIASYAMPHHILFTKNLPKTRSGKIMRRILRKITSNSFDDLGDLTTLSDPLVVECLIKEYKTEMSIVD